MNRIIIIGNGFDLSKGLHTSYASFVKDYITKCFKRFITESFYDGSKDLISFNWEYNKIRISEKSIEEIEIFTLIERHKSRGLQVNFNSQFFKVIYNKVTASWVDIEKEYYNFLFQNFNDKNHTAVIKLNNDLTKIKELLRCYLIKQQDILKNSSIELSEAFGIFDTRIIPTKDKRAVENEIKKSKMEDDDELFILNFNYTKPNFIYNQPNISIVNIHGTLDNPKSMILGYGDEYDPNYIDIERDGTDDYLENFKSFGYFQSREYDKVVSFIEKGNFQVFIVGHSCGLSDKTLLNQIFSHNECKNIRLFYHKKADNTDNYNELTYSIARIMKDKIKMRRIVSKKPDCLHIDEILRDK